MKLDPFRSSFSVMVHFSYCNIFFSRSDFHINHLYYCSFSFLLWHVLGYDFGSKDAKLNSKPWPKYQASIKKKKLTWLEPESQLRTTERKLWCHGKLLSSLNNNSNDNFKKLLGMWILLWFAFGFCIVDVWIYIRNFGSFIR